MLPIFSIGYILYYVIYVCCISTQTCVYIRDLCTTAVNPGMMDVTMYVHVPMDQQDSTSVHPSKNSPD